MHITEMKTVEGKLCVFLDAPKSDSGTLCLLDDADLQKFRWAHDLAVKELLAAQNQLGDVGNDIQTAIDLLERLPL